MPPERFIDEPIRPDPGAIDTQGPAAGEPGLPWRFTWRGAEYIVAEQLEKWKDTGPCHHGSGERYVRRHWFRVRTTGGLEMKIYCDRQARSRGARPGAARRWWLYTMITPGQLS